MYTSKSVQVGDKVLILRPAYVIGKVGVVCGFESHSENPVGNRCIIQVEAENIMVSLTPDEFKLLSPGFQ